MTPGHIALAVVVMAIWGLNFVAAKTGLAGLPPLLLMALRFGIVALVMVWFVPRPTPGHWRHIFWLSITLGSLHFSLMFTGLTRVDASVAAIAIQLQVPFAAILAAWLFSDPPGWRRALGMALAFSGVVVLAGAPGVTGDLPFLGLVIAASLVWAVANIHLRQLNGRLPGHTLNAWISVFSAPQFLLLSLLFEDGQATALANADWRTWAAILYMAVVVTMIAYGLWYAMIARYPTNQTMPFTLLVPVFGVLAGAALLGEPVGWQVLAGGGATVLGVAIIVLRRPRVAGPAGRG